MNKILLQKSLVNNFHFSFLQLEINQYVKILVVDDDTDILSVMEILLTMKGFEVEVTTKGENTFLKIETFRPDLILLDVLISGHDGRTICRKRNRIKKQCTFP